MPLLTKQHVPLVLKFADFKHGLHSALFSAGVLHKHSFLPFSVSTIDPACVLVQCQLSNCFHRWKKLKHLQSQPDKKIINNYNKKNLSIPDNKKTCSKIHVSLMSMEGIPFTPTNDQSILSPHSIYTISDRKVMRT